MGGIWNTSDNKCWWDKGQVKSRSLLSGTERGRLVLQHSLAVSYRAQHRRSIQSRNRVSWYLHKWPINSDPHKNLHLDPWWQLCSELYKIWKPSRYCPIAERINRYLEKWLPGVMVPACNPSTWGLRRITIESSRPALLYSEEEKTGLDAVQC